MKKNLAIGLVLCILMSFGSICFAAGEFQPDLCYKALEMYGKSISRRGLGKHFTFSFNAPGKGRCSIHVKNANLIDSERSHLKILMDGMDVYDFVIFTDFGARSTLSCSEYVQFDYDAKGRSIVSCNEFINFGDGNWYATAQFYNPTSWESPWQRATTIRSKAQYKYEIVFEDGTEVAVKFRGSELLECEDGELDMGVLCLRNVFVNPSSELWETPELELEILCVN